MRQERWKKIPSFPRYEISTHGRMRSIRYKGKSLPRAVTPIVGKDGYYKISIYDPLGVRKTCRRARLILETFVGPCPLGKQAAHLNGNRVDDRLDNLAWVTSKENHSHKKIHGTTSQGINNPKARLSERDVLNIRKWYAQGKYDGVELSRMFNIKHTAIYSIIHRKNWSHI